MKTKKIASLLVLVLTLLVAFSACSKEKKLIGTWKAQTTTLGIVTETTLVLNEGGTGTSTGLLGVTGDITYTVSDNIITITFSGLLTSNTQTFEFEVKGDTLTLISAADSVTYTRVS